MKPLRWSIGLRLALWYVLIFAIAQGVFGVGMYLVLRHHLRTIVNDGLRQEMRDLQNVLVSLKPELNTQQLSEEINEAYAQDHAGQYLQIFTTQGETIYVSPFLSRHPLPAMPPAASPAVYFEDRRMDNGPFRFLDFVFEARGRTFLVQLGTPTGEIYETLGTFRHYLLLLAPLVLLGAALGGNWLSHRALAPVDKLTRTAHTINVTNLSRRLESPGTGDELQRLSDTLNEMLARIESSVRRITEFTADASHELRTPVALIRAEAEVALSRDRTDEEYRSSLEHVLLESERMTQLLEQLLALVRADSGSETMPMVEFDIARLVRDAVEAWEKIAAPQGQGITLSAPDPAILITGNSQSIRRVLDVLLDNAVKYGTPPGAIAVAIEPYPDRVVLRVRDHGLGIPPEEQSKIFERFYRVDKARSRRMGGAGLGLAIAQWIVHQHHGSISVQSQPNQGAEFTVELPKSAAFPR